MKNYIKTILERIVNYRTGPVAWWGFWNPLSGIAGGLFGGTLIWIAIYLYLAFYT